MAATGEQTVALSSLVERWRFPLRSQLQTAAPAGPVRGVAAGARRLSGRTAAYGACVWVNAQVISLGSVLVIWRIVVFHVNVALVDVLSPKVGEGPLALGVDEPKPPAILVRPRDGTRGPGRG